MTVPYAQLQVEPPTHYDDGREKHRSDKNGGNNISKPDSSSFEGHGYTPRGRVEGALM